MMGKKGMLRGLALGCLMAALSLAQPVSSEAAGNIWMDESAEVQAKSFKKVVATWVNRMAVSTSSRATTPLSRSASTSASSGRTS